MSSSMKDIRMQRHGRDLYRVLNREKKRNRSLLKLSLKSQKLR